MAKRKAKPHHVYSALRKNNLEEAFSYLEDIEFPKNSESRSIFNLEESKKWSKYFTEDGRLSNRFFPGLSKKVILSVTKFPFIVLGMFVWFLIVFVLSYVILGLVKEPPTDAVNASSEIESQTRESADKPQEDSETFVGKNLTQQIIKDDREDTLWGSASYLGLSQGSLVGFFKINEKSIFQNGTYLLNNEKNYSYIEAQVLSKEKYDKIQAIYNEVITNNQDKLYKFKFNRRVSIRERPSLDNTFSLGAKTRTDKMVLFTALALVKDKKEDYIFGKFKEEGNGDEERWAVIYFFKDDFRNWISHSN